MELFNAIYGRRSIRRFNKKRIEIEKLKKIISAAAVAPSACNIQGWKFIIIDNEKTKRELINAGAISFIEDAPIGIMVVYDAREEGLGFHDHIQSASAAIENLILAAYSMGIGSCWVCHLPTKNVIRRILNIPQQYDPIAYIAMGYYDKKPQMLKRKYSFDELVSFNSFKFADTTPKKELMYRFIKRIAFRIYKFVPFKKRFSSITKKLEAFNQKKDAKRS